jgi:sugar phosphate isomerase/epimerase
MRFGIMEMQVEYLVPDRVVLVDRIGAGLSPAFDHPDMVSKLAKGFNVIELGGDLAMFSIEAFDASAITRLKALKQAQGLSYTVHLPLWSVEPSTPLAPVRQGSVNAIVDVIRATWPLEPEVYVLHAFGALASEFFRMRLPDAVHAALLEQFQMSALDSVKRILAATAIPSRRLAIETIEFPLRRTLALAEMLDLSICFDTGHVLSGFSGAIDLFDALDKSLPRLAEVHLHDAPLQMSQENIIHGRDHQALGRGDLDVARFLKRLREADFRGPIIFELTVPEALESFEVIRSVYPDALS